MLATCSDRAEFTIKETFLHLYQDHTTVLKNHQIEKINLVTAEMTHEFGQSQVWNDDFYQFKWKEKDINQSCSNSNIFNSSYNELSLECLESSVEVKLCSFHRFCFTLLFRHRTQFHFSPKPKTSLVIFFVTANQLK